ncbi:MAG: Na/Pi cotransporter family protein [Bacteroidetes bacterium]|nr:Na/Pi cotransporter family protein [Bacteroidota bacterium]
MSYGLIDFLTLLGSLGIFIYGMKVMSEGIQKAAGSSLRRILQGMTANRYVGVITGFAVTALIQSSSATTVMVVSFVNAGLMTLFESMGVIMGANIGTTVTSWLVYYFGFKVNILSIAIPLIGIAFPFLFARRNRLKHVAEFFVGFGILFIGLHYLKESVPNIKDNPEIMEFIAPYVEYGFLSVLIFVAVGALLTVVVQSSSASLAITLVMVANGWIDFEMAAAMYVGGNIGTTVTAILASLVANIHAKRTALFHFIFNVLGSVWVLFVFTSFLRIIDNFLSQIFGLSVNDVDAAHQKETIMLALSIFHTAFNTINTIILIGFIPLLEKMVVWMMPAKKEEDIFHLQFISTGLMATAELSLAQAKKEIQVFGRILDKLCLNVMALIFEKSKEFNSISDKIKSREEMTDTLEVEISNYLSKCAEGDITGSTSKKIKNMFRMINDMERIGDIFYQIMITSNKMRDSKIQFTEEIREELRELIDKIYAGIKTIRENLKDENMDIVEIQRTYKLEAKINALRDKFQQKHYDRLEAGEYSIQEGIMYLDVLNSLEKIGDHVVNVNEAIAGLK